MTQQLVEMLEIAVEEIMPDPSQPRKHFLDEEIARLAASMAIRGVLQPLRVRRDESRKCYHIITGESRWRAAPLARLKTLPCLLVTGELSEIDILSDQLTENMMRHALKPMEQARSLAKLKALKRCTAQQLAAETGISNASFSRSEALLSLPEDIQVLVDSGAISESVAYEISRIDNPGAQFELAHAVVGRRMNRDQVIEAVRKQVGKKTVTPKAGRVTGKLDGVSFSFSGGQLTPETLLKAIEQIRAKLNELKKTNQTDVSALAELLRAS